MRKLIQNSLFLLIIAFSLNVYSQVYSVNDIINIYDPFLITINDMTVNSADDELRENPYVFIVTLSYGNEKIIKFLKPDDLTLNSVKERDNYSTYNFTVKKNNTVLLPAYYNIQNMNGMLNIKFEGFSSIADIDVISLNNLSTSFVYTSSNMNRNIELAYKYVATNTDINRPNNALLTTAEVLQQNIKTRPGVYALGSPLEGNYVLPQDPTKVLGPNVLMQGKKTVEARVGNRNPESVNFTVTKLTDTKIVAAQPYYIRVKTLFSDLSAYNIVPIDKREGLIARANEIINNELTIGLKQDIYINDQAANQLTNLLNLLKAGVRVKSDTLAQTNDVMNSNEREALSFFESNLKGNEFNVNNQYVYDEFIGSSANRGVIQKEIDAIKRYYQIK